MSRTQNINVLTPCQNDFPEDRNDKVESQGAEFSTDVREQCLPIRCIRVAGDETSHAVG